MGQSAIFLRNSFSTPPPAPRNVVKAPCLCTVLRIPVAVNITRVRGFLQMTTSLNKVMATAYAFCVLSRNVLARIVVDFLRSVTELNLWPANQTKPHQSPLPEVWAGLGPAQPHTHPTMPTGHVVFVTSTGVAVFVFFLSAWIILTVALNSHTSAYP